MSLTRDITIDDLTELVKLLPTLHDAQSDQAQADTVNELLKHESPLIRSLFQVAHGAGTLANIIALADEDMARVVYTATKDMLNELSSGFAEVGAERGF